MQVLHDFGQLGEVRPYDSSDIEQEVIPYTCSSKFEGQLEIRINDPGLERLRQDNREIARRRSLGVAGAAGLVTAAILLGLDAEPAWLGWAIGAMAAWLLLDSSK